MNTILSYKPFITWLLFAAVALSTPTFAESPIYTGVFSSKAVSGYDTVAYFTESKAVEGKAKYSTEYNDTDWYFSSQKNLALFKTDPEKYVPQYGGYCSWAVAHNSTAKGDPTQWTVHDSKLYLNYDTGIQEKWLKAKSTLITKANKNWPQVLDQ
ncbi:MAG: YHS domain-containing protein [Pseudohongiellaceae bacterium]|jgi:YHS domain-containing protein